MDYFSLIKKPKLEEISILLREYHYTTVDGDTVVVRMVPAVGIDLEDLLDDDGDTLPLPHPLSREDVLQRKHPKTDRPIGLEIKSQLSKLGVDVQPGDDMIKLSKKLAAKNPSMKFGLTWG